MKFCKKCSLSKNVDEFGKNKRMVDGLYPICKSCRKKEDEKYKDKTLEYQRKWAKENPEKTREYKKRYREANPDKDHQYYLENIGAIKTIHKEYQEENRQEIAIKKAEYYQKNKGKQAEYSKNYREIKKSEIKIKKAGYYQKNKSEDRENKNIKYRERYEKDVEFRLSVCLRSRLRQAIKKVAKTGSAIADLGCSIEELRKYLESKFYSSKAGENMSWDNYGKGWQIDHIEAFCLFDLTNREELLRVCNYTNLWPLWHEDHIIKTEADLKKRK